MTTVAERPKKKAAGSKRRDPASTYAQRVISGKIVAGLAVRQACARHLNDLERERTKDFPYYFDRISAQHIIDFFPRFLTLESGAPFVLPEWLQFCYGCIYGWKRVEDGLRKYQYGFFETSKGSGKSPSAGGVGLYGMAFDDEPYAEIYCLDPKTRILHSDFSWRPVGDALVGDELIAFDEYPEPGSRRKLRHASVTSAKKITQPCYRITLDDGREIVASATHKWLGMLHSVGERKSWIETRHLRVGSRIRDLGKPWEFNNSRDAGYLAGIFDGEAGFHKGKKGRSGFRIACAQKPGAVMDETRRISNSLGFQTSPIRKHASGVDTFEVRGLYDCFRFLGTIRPARLLSTAKKWLDGFSSKSNTNSHAVVQSIEFIHDREVIAIGTSTQTLFAEGLFSHNSAAFDKDQASIILNDAIRMASNSPDLAEILTIDKYNIAHEGSGSFFRAVSSEHRGKSGPRPFYVLGDEIHEQRDGRVINKMLAGFKGRLQPLALLYTNSGSDRTSICWEYHQKSLAVLEGSLVDEQWFAYVSHLDPCAECFDAGYRQPKDGCENCDDWTDPAVWPKVAPALGVVIQPKYLQDAVDAALSLPSEFALKRRLNFCIWTETHQTWISAQRWDACKAPALIIPGTHVSACAAAFDMSEKLDLTACDFAQRIDDDAGMKPDEVELTTVEDGKEVTQTLNLNFRIILTPYFWIPEETMLARIDQERIPYDAWMRKPESRLTVTPGPIIDHDFIFERFKNTLAPAYKPTMVGYDQHNAVQFGAALRDRGRFNAVEVPQGRRLSEAFKWFEALVMARRIIHDGDPVLAWCVANCEAKYDRYRNMWVEKPSATKRIDGAMAAVMALYLLMRMPRAPEFKVLILGGRR